MVKHASTAPSRAWKQRALLALLLVPLASCLQPADERAELDEHAGSAEADGVRVSTEGQLAAVRELSQTRLRLWLQAPTVVFEVEGANAGFELRLANVLADARLSASSDTAQPLELTELAPLGTSERVWRLDASAGRVRFVLDASFAYPLEIAYFSDLQQGIDDFDPIVAAFAAEPALRFALFGGDLSNRGTMAELRRGEAALERLGLPVYQTLGNHDLANAQSNWSTFFGPSSFHFDYGELCVSFLDSGSATLEPAIYERLGAWLEHDEARTHIVVTHYPLFDPIGTRNGAFRSRKEAAKLASLLASHDTDLLLHGHVHSYYAYSVAGIPAYIAGGATTLLERMSGIGRHFLVLHFETAGDPSVSLRRID